MPSREIGGAKMLLSCALTFGLTFPISFVSLPYATQGRP